MFKRCKIGLAAALLAPATSMAATIDVQITNLTHAIYFTPLLIAAHNTTADIFEPGTAASTNLQALAEGGSLDGFTSALDGIASVQTNPAGGVLGPGVSTTVSDMDTESYSVLSVAAMLLPTNDGFVGLDSWAIPTTPGTYTLYMNAYDAGTEANNELIVSGGGTPGTLGIPADPGGNSSSPSSGSGVTTTENNTTVHIHRGNLGDSSDPGGESDLLSTVHRWLNPVAKVVVTVK